MSRGNEGDIAVSPLDYDARGSLTPHIVRTFGICQKGRCVVSTLHDRRIAANISAYLTAELTKELSDPPLSVFVLRPVPVRVGASADRVAGHVIAGGKGPPLSRVLAECR